MQLCHERETDHHSMSLSVTLEFLMSLYPKDPSYSTINTARSALHCILDVQERNKLGPHPLVVRFMKGVFEKRKPQPKYTNVWDVSKVLNYLQTLSPIQDLSLKDLTLKFQLIHHVKTSKPGQPVKVIAIPTFTSDFRMDCTHDLCSNEGHLFIMRGDHCSIGLSRFVVSFSADSL